MSQQTIKLKGTFGEFTWELPEEVSRRIENMSDELQKAVILIYQDNIAAMLHILLGIIVSGEHAPAINDTLKRALRGVSEKSIELLEG